MKTPFPVIDLRLLTWAEEKSSLKSTEKEHQRLHKNNKAHIHLDGNRG